MSDNPGKPQRRVTPKQWLTVGVLATVFVGVLVSQFAGPPRPPGDHDHGYMVPDRVPAGAAAGAAGRDASRKSPQPDPIQPAPPWPGFPLAKLLEFDPFAPPAGLASVPDGIHAADNAEKAAAQKSADAERDRAKRQQAVERLRKEVVRAVVGTDHGFAAIVGGRTVQVGDRLHGFRVKEIQADGVILEGDHD